MAVLTVVCNQLTFGCAKAVDERHRPATMLVYDSPRHLFLHRPPQKGERFLCECYHSSVYLPTHQIFLERAALQHSPLPTDLLDSYFPVVVPLTAPRLRAGRRPPDAAPPSW